MLPSIFGENLFDDFFDDFDKDFFGGRNPLYGKRSKNLMKTDVKEGYLTVSAAKGLDKDEEDKEGRYIRRERYAGTCSRSFYVGDVRPEDVQCKYEFGVLHLRIPKADAALPETPHRIAIE